MLHLLNRFKITLLCGYVIFSSFITIAQKPKWLNISTPSSITSIVEQEDTLWLATEGGLVKWNKKTKTPSFYNKSGQGALMTSIRCMVIDQKGVKWLGTYNLGLVIVNGSDIQIKNSSIIPSWKYDNIINITIDKYNNKWLTSGSNLVKIDSLMNITEYTLPTYREITSLVIDSNNVKWIGTTSGLLKFKNTFETITSTDNFTFTEMNYITCLGIGKKGKLYIGTSTQVNTQGGLFTFDGAKFVKYGVGNYEVKSMVVDSFGTATIGGATQIASFDGNQVTSMNYISFIPRVIFKDKAGEIWYGGNDYRLGNYINSENYFDIRFVDFPSNSINTIKVENGKTVWIASNGGLSLLENNKIKTFNGANSYGIPGIRSIFIDSKNNKWLGGTEGHVTKFDGERLVQHNDFRDKYGYSPIQSIKEDSTGRIWLSGNIFANYDGSTWNIFNSSPNLPPNNTSIVNFDIDKKGKFWVGTTRGFFLKEGLNWTLYANLTSYKNIHIDKFNNKWLSTGNYSGIDKFDDNTFKSYTKANSGLPSDAVEAITSDKDGTIWLGSDGGNLVKFDGINWKSFNPTNSGIPSTYITSIAVDDNKNIWIGTDHGLVIFNENGVDLDFSPQKKSTYNSILSPKMSEPIKACTSYQTVTLRAKLLEDAYVYFSSDNGKKWQPVTKAFAGTDNFYWSTPAVNSNDCRLRLVTVSQKDTIETAGVFSINYLSGKSISLSSPISNDSIAVGESKTIKWSSVGITGNVIVEYSNNLGTYWNPIAYNTPNTGSYIWSTKNMDLGSYLIKVSDASTNCVFDIGFLKLTEGLTTSIDEQNNQFVSTIYPNPSKGKFYFNDRTGIKMNFKLFDLYGKEINFEQMPTDNGEVIHILDDKKGIMFLQVGSRTHKIFVE